MELGITICCCLCNKFSTKTTEILLIVIFSIASLSLISFIGLANLSIISYYNLFLIFFSLILLIICLLFSVCFRLWRNKGTIKTSKKNISINMATAGIILIVTCLFSCAINEYLILNDFEKTYNLSCDTNNNKVYIDNNLKSKRKLSKNKCGEDISEFGAGIIYFSFSCVELVAFLGVFFFSIMRERIIFGLDMPKPANISSQENNYIPQQVIESPLAANAIVYQPDIFYPRKIDNNPQDIIILGEDKINNNIEEKNDYNFELKKENIKKQVNAPLNQIIFPKINRSNLPQQISTTQQSQINSSQSIVSFPKSNFSSNKGLIHNIGKQNINQSLSPSSERKI